MAQVQSQQEDARGLYDKGMNATRGSEIDRNDRDTLEFFRRSAEMGYVPAQVVLGYMYETGFAIASEPARRRTGTRKPLSRAILWAVDAGPHHL